MMSKLLLPYLKNNKKSLCILADDPDNLPIVVLADYLMFKNKAMSRDKALELLKERKP